METQEKFIKTSRKKSPMEPFETSMTEYQKKSLTISKGKFLEEMRKESQKKILNERIPEGVTDEISKVILGKITRKESRKKFFKESPDESLNYSWEELLKESW